VILVIDSATEACSAALLGAGLAPVAARHELVGRGHAERLVPMIAELIGEAGAPAVSEIWVDCGPGSFTGVRVGLAAARGLAIGWGVPVRGYSSLALIAAAARVDPVVVALKGGHGELFVQSYGGDPIAPLDPLRSLAPAAAAAEIRAGEVHGSGAEALVAARGGGVWRDAWPEAALAGLLPPPLRDLAPRPIYGRAPDARPMSA
jgi:tRNA threonylcarbamoyladenosine biosynthesis protein TsaB